MKLGLITIHDTLNWGSLAQTYGLYHALEILGIDIQLINYKNEKIFQKERIKSFSEIRSFRDLIFYLQAHKTLLRKKRGYDGFLEKHVKLTEAYNNLSVKKTNEQFDAFIVGSDIVWGVEITGFDYSYLLDFVEDSKVKLAFSPSAGDRWPSSEDAKYKELLSRFDAISVREHPMASWLEEVVGKKFPVTGDPSILWDGDFYRSLEERPKGMPDDFVVCYMDADRNDALKYGKEYNLPVYEIQYMGRPRKGINWVSPMSFGEWLWLLDHSKMTFCGSFHGMLFSLYFNTPFFWYHAGRNSRQDSIATECNIMHRLANDGYEENLKLNKPIDFDYVNKIIKGKREYSWKVLQGYAEILK